MTTKTALEQLADLQAERAERLAKLTLDAAKGSGPVTLKLSAPFKLESGAEVAELNVREHTVRDLKDAADKGEAEAPFIIFGQMTGLAPADVGKLSEADFDALAAIKEGFTFRRAG